VIRLETDRPDPENRSFKHPDPLGWTDQHRAEILRALYTILLGNPTLKLPRYAPMKTRFPMWWRLVGSAVEHAAKLMADHVEPGAYDDEPDDPARPVAIDFQKLFLERDEEDEESTGLAEALDILHRHWPTPFTAIDVAKFMNTDQLQTKDAYGNLMFDQYGNPVLEDNVEGSVLLDFFYPSRLPKFRATTKSLGRLLHTNHLKNPVPHGNRVLMLRERKDPHTKTLVYWVEVKP
jgi:hypothetical protein